MGADLGAEYLADSTLPPALCYAVETRPDTSAMAKSLRVTQTGGEVFSGPTFMNEPAVSETAAQPEPDGRVDERLCLT
ncbi:unnamed protein product [Nippostrongylus brasiliensis]|uniref:Lipoprotein n=1 Tax=Nippostrongylus brasiliensis TaxID=27835 RepID=A0A0N4YEZ5_NIPBR|nr:unnamed protein product [Nippostrongylus brasiliensis]